MTDFRDARRLYDIHSVLGIPRNKNVIVCPLPFHAHQNNTPSFSIYNGRKGQLFACHGSCGKEGDVLDLVGYVKIFDYNPNNPQHVKRALTILSSGYSIDPVKAEKKRNPYGLPVDKWKEFPASETVFKYALSRGLTRETVLKFRLGQCNTENHRWMSIPCFNREKLMAIKLRNMNPTGVRDRFSQVAGGTPGLFNVNAVREIERPVLVVKSEIPCMLLDQFGFDVCAPTVSENVWAEAASWYVELSFSRKRVLVADNDANPKVREEIMKYGAKRAELLHAELRTPPEKYKDIDQFVLAEPEAALTLIRSWLYE